jgi:surface protein
MGDFISVWSVPAVNTQIILPIISGIILNDVTVDWGDNSNNNYNFEVTNANRPSHTYTTVGDKTIIITGPIPGWSFASVGTPSFLKSITQYGRLELANTGSQFRNCVNLETFAVEDNDDGEFLIKLPQNCSSMFRDCILFNNVSFLLIDARDVTDMSHMFHGCTNFNHNRVHFNTKNVITMESMFQGCTNFNSLLQGGVESESWLVENVQNMSNMFKDCINFDEVIAWDVTSVTNMSGMFDGCTNFTGKFQYSETNVSLSIWNSTMNKVNNMSNMFRNCTHFTGTNDNNTLKDWDVRSVQNMSNMFSGCSVFNSDISNWDVRQAKNMQNIFFNCVNFRKDVSKWILSRIENNQWAPAFTDDYINNVKPNFSTDYQSSWRFNAPVTQDVISTVIPAASRSLYYIDRLLRIRHVSDQQSDNESTSRIKSVNSGITRSYNSVIY